MYAEGKGVEQDYSKAAEWYLKAAEQGYVKAQFNLGNMYYTGRGVKRDYQEARKWWKNAAEQGNERAQKALEKYFER
mgnify:FL=1